MSETLMQQAQAFLQPCLDLLFPPRCTVCQRGGSVLCPTCFAEITLFRPPLCPLCGRSLFPVERGKCRRCRRWPLQVSGLRIVGPYEEPLRSCIHALKYQGQQRLAQPLGRLLAQTYRNTGMRADAILALPLHCERERERGYNQSYLLARVCAQQLGLPLLDGLLVRTRATAAQAQLPADQRQHNVAHAFSATPAAYGTITGRTLLVIDDVCTTGATLEACAEPLFAAGAAAVWGLVLARP